MENRNRPLRVGRTRTTLVHIPSPLSPHRRMPPFTSALVLTARSVSEGSRPPWEGAPLKFSSAPIRKPINAIAAGESKDSIHRATLPSPVPDSDLEAACAAPVAFQDSDGIELSENGTCARNAFLTTTRQAVLSTNWVHIEHGLKKVTWNLRIKQAQFEYGDVFFGLTEATSFHLDGRSISFDVRGNFNVGWSPQTLSHRFRAKSLADVEGASVEGTLDGPKECDLTVTADLEQSHVIVTLPNGAITYPLDGWTSARLFVSFSSHMDTVCLL